MRNKISRQNLIDRNDRLIELMRRGEEIPRHRMIRLLVLTEEQRNNLVVQAVAKLKHGKESLDYPAFKRNKMQELKKDYFDENELKNELTLLRNYGIIAHVRKGFWELNPESRVETRKFFLTKNIKHAEKAILSEDQRLIIYGFPTDKMSDPDRNDLDRIQKQFLNWAKRLFELKNRIIRREIAQRLSLLDSRITPDDFDRIFSRIVKREFDWPEEERDAFIEKVKLEAGFPDFSYDSLSPQSRIMPGEKEKQLESILSGMIYRKGEQPLIAVYAPELMIAERQIQDE